MQSTQPTAAPAGPTPPITGGEHSVVSWGAVLAGAMIGAALSAMLIVGASGLGFLSVSPWQGEGISAATLTVGTIGWLLVTQVIAYGISGYITGRLRTRWSDGDADEIYFRDTAHGFLVWAVSVVISLALLGSVFASVASGTAKTGAAVAAGTASAVAAEDAPAERSLDYFTDTLLRAEDPSAAERHEDTRREVGTILLRSVTNGELTSDDESYLVQVVANRAEVSEDTARQRVEQAWGQIERAEEDAREAADTARKAAAAFSLWAFISLLLGAFVASFTATLGGRAQDR